MKLKLKLKMKLKMKLSKKVESTAYRVDSAPTQNFCQDWGKRARLIQARLIHLG